MGAKKSKLSSEALKEMSEKTKCKSIKVKTREKVQKNVFIGHQ